MKTYIPKIALVLFSFLFVGWGSIGHRIINRNVTLSFPNELNFLLFWSDSLAAHGSDADNRKSWDPNEAPKHYIDIDNYPEFVSTGRISQSFDSVIAQHGYSFVIDQGILPWAILETVDSLQAAFQRRDWNRAMLTAADLGHYIGDCCMPLHLTRNYNGQYTGQSGVHSRYESTMIQNYYQQIVYSGETVEVASNLPNLVFELVYANYKYVDSVLQADIIAKSYSGGSYNSTYYAKLWELTKNYTIQFHKNASHILAKLIYTAWKNAGEPTITNIEYESAVLNDFKLEQNYPNPFNSSTIISWQSLVGSHQSLKVYDALGNEVAALINEFKPAGRYEAEFQSAIGSHQLPSGVYYYQLITGSFVQTMKMILIK